jgi:large subunit ribosomal protein L27
MAHKKAGGSTKNIGGSGPKYLGIKLCDGQQAKPGSILVRQRGTKILPGRNVKVGRDHTLFALKSGKVKFTQKRKINFNGLPKKVKIINVV